MRRFPTQKDDRILAPTRGVSAGIVPVLIAAFVVLYVFSGDTMRLWAWMLCPEMSALVLGGGYLSGAYFFARVAREREWHRVGAGFVATTTFATMLMATTVLHWDVFNHDHVSFWAWLLLYATTPVLLPVLWRNNRRTDPRWIGANDVTVPRRLRVAVAAGGSLQLAFAAVMLLWPDRAADVWPWPVDTVALRAMSAFVAFPAVTWVSFLFDRRWSSFRITQQTVTLGLLLVAAGALRSRPEFRSDGWFAGYLLVLAVALALSATLYVSMERRVRVAAPEIPGRPRVDDVVAVPHLVG